MSAKPMEVFPDLHHKMSKKIAQLTKVIYHLNTKNEDHQSELDVLNSNHQLEIQQILRDAASRIGKFKEVIESKQSSMNQDAKIEKLQKKHEAEKQTAIQEFNNFKAKMNERDQKIAQSFQTKYAALRGELETMNKKFQEKVEQFEKTNKSLKESLDATSKSGSSSIAELTKKHEEEVAELVRSSNEKFQAMLVEQLQAQANIRKEMEDKLAQLRKDLDEAHDKALEVALGQERARMGGDKQEAVMALRRELEDQLAQQKQAATQDAERAALALKEKADECARIEAAAAKNLADLLAKQEAMQRSLNDQVGGQEKKAGALAQELAAVQEELSKQQARTQQREEELTAMRSMLQEKNAALVTLEDKLAAANTEIQKLQAEVETARMNGASNLQDMVQKLNAAQREAESFRTEINQIAASLANVRDELKRSEKNAQKAAQDASKAMDDLRAEKDLLSKKLQDMKSNANSASSEAQEKMEKLRQEMEAVREKGQQEKLQAIQEQEKLLATLKDNHRIEMESLQASRKKQEDDFMGRESAWHAERTELQSKYASESEAMLQEHQRLFDEATSKYEAEKEVLKGSLSEMESQMQNMSEQADSERTSLKTEITKWEGKARNLQKELENRKKDGERAESVTTGLKNQVESLREELKASQKAFRDKMDMDKGKLEAEWQARLDAQQAAADQTLNELKQELQKHHQGELEDLARRHEEEVLSLKALLQKEHNNAASEMADNEKKRQQLEAELKTEKSERASEMAELKALHAAQWKELEAAHKQEVEKTQRELKTAAETREAELVDAHTAEVDRLNQLVEGTTNEYTQRMAAALEASKVSAEEQLRSALAALEAKCKREQLEALDAQSRENTEATRVLTAQFETEKDALLKSMSDIRQQFVDASGQISQLEKVIAEERDERQRREEVFVQEKSQLERAHESDIRREKEASERKVLEVMERANTDVNILKQEHLEVRGQYEDRLQDVLGQYKSLEQRYLNRESREEDIDRIRSLEQEMVEKDELVARTKEEMMYFKREMLNREENYNQKFGQSPNVGVMQVLKTKDPTGASGKNAPNKSGGASKTQMRMINPNGGNNNMMGGIGGGMGMGVGGGSVKNGRSSK